MQRIIIHDDIPLADLAAFAADHGCRIEQERNGTLCIVPRRFGCGEQEGQQGWRMVREEER